MIKFMSPAELKAMYEQWASVPGNGAAMCQGIRSWIAGQLAEHSGALLTGESWHLQAVLNAPFNQAVAKAAGSEEAAQRIWVSAVHEVLRELSAAGWGIIPDPVNGPSWIVGFRVLGPCARHGMPVDPVIGGCQQCVDELPRPEPGQVMMIQFRPEVVN